MSTDVDATRARALAFLDERDAAGVEHLQGTLFEHLVNVETLLRQWGAPESLAIAGLCHATYGTDGFAPFLLGLQERSVLRGVIGNEAEETVYFYASCDRTVVYPRLGPPPVTWRDRFSAGEFEATPAQLRDFVELTMANEVEIAAAAGNPQEWTWLADFCRKVRPLASVDVYRGAASILGLA